MAKRAEKSRKPQYGWGKAGRIARGPVLALALVAGASTLQAEPLEADTAPASRSMSTAGERAPIVSTSNLALPAPQMSVSAFSAAQSNAARILLAQEIRGESNRAVGTVPFPVRPQPTAAIRQGGAQDRLSEAAEATQTEESLIVGRSLRAYTRAGENEEDSEASTPRRRASFSSAISRAAASGALTSVNPNASVGNALSPSRFTPAGNLGQFDPGFSKAAEALSVIPGLRLESATLFGGYSSNVMPRSFGSAFYGRTDNLGADYDLGASALISYSRQGRRSMTSFTYAPSHVQRSRIPEWSTTDHRFSFQSSRDLTPRLSLRTTANAGNTGLEQFWTRPPVIRRVEAPASFDELMKKVLAGEISNDEFAAILTGSPIVDDPGGSMQDLNRIFSASVGASASYAYSRRMTFNFGAGSSMIRQFATDNHDRPGFSNYLSLARITNAQASADYRFSSRTSISLRHVTSFADSGFASSVAHSPTIGFNQVLSRHWSYGLAAGVGSIHFDPTRSSRTYLTDTTTWTANGSLGYANGPHQVSLSAGKQVGDPMGYGSRSTAQASLTWNWQPRFSTWGATAGVAFSRSQFGVGSQLFDREFMSDLYSAGLSRRLTASTTFRSDYYYGEYASPFSGIVSNMSLHRLQMSLVWRPAEPRQ